MVENGFDLNRPVDSSYTKQITKTVSQGISQISSSLTSMLGGKPAPGKGTKDTNPTPLDLALAKEDYALAGFLVMLGAKPDDTDPDAANLKQYAEALKRGGPAEQHLRTLINAKNVAHLVGDAIVGDMLGDDGEKLEGNLPSESLTFLSAALDDVREKHPERLSEQAQTVCKRLNEAASMAVRLS